MYKAIVIRLLPTQSQAKLFWQNVGTARWTWNWGLDTQNKAYSEQKKFLSVNELKRKFTEVRNSEKFKWLQEVSRQVEANALIDLDKAYSKFFIQCRHNILSHMNIAPICTEAMNEDAFFA